ncbi:MAG: MFS transporter [Rhodospirillaceae bacterium]|nr:MFS transporter [Rhodospirillaceae bacterium]
MKVGTTVRPDVEPWPGAAQAWFVVAALSVASLFSFLDRTVISLLVQPIKTDLLLSDTEIGVLQGAAFGVFYTLMIIPFGWVADHGNRIRLVFCGMIVWSLMTAACGLATNFWEMFAARVGIGIGEATLAASAASIIADHFPAARRTLPLSVYTLVASAGVGVGLVGGAIIATTLADVGTLTVPVLGTLQMWQLVFIAVGLPGLGWALVLLTMREPARRENTGDDATWGELFDFVKLRRRVIGLHFFGYCFYNTFGYGAGGWLPVFFMREYGWGIAEVGTRYGILYLIMPVVGGVACGWVVRKLMERGRVDANLYAIAINNTLMTVPGVLTPLMPNGWLALVMVTPLIAIFVFPSGASLAAIQEITPNRLRGRMTALYYAVTNLVGISLGTVFIGALTDYVFRDEMRVGDSIALAAVLLCPLGGAIMFLAARARRTLAAA